LGFAIKELIKSKEITIDELNSKTLIIDSFNLLYQFITTIRGPDGSPLTDSKGNVTSHLIGLFSRTANLLRKGLKLAFVFDGVAPDLKKAERYRRKQIKLDAQKQYDVAKEQGDIAEMKKFAPRTSRLTPEMIAEAKELISAFGCPVILAPSEGEAQAAYMVKKGDAFATVSQDFDTLLHNSSKLVRNLSIAGKRKKNNKLGYYTVKPEIINLSENLNLLGIDNDQLIVMAMLIGTDYNIGGIKGIGPMKALSFVKKYGKEFDELFKDVKWEDFFDFAWSDVYYQIKQMPVTDDYKLEWGKVDREAIITLLCTEHDFLLERVEKTLEKFGNQEQKGLSEFF